MNIENIRYMYHLDEIRIKKNITVEKLCENICSTRQYRKYLSGENNISDARITEFCNVLGISTRDFYYTLKLNDTYEFEKVHSIYLAITNKEYEEAKHLFQKINNIDSFSVQNRKYFEYCRIRYKLEQKAIYNSDAFDLFKNIIDYPNCINNNAFDIIDLMIIQKLAEFEVTIQKYEGLDLLKKILTNKDLLYLSAETRSIMPAIYSTVAILLGRLKRYDECIDISLSGIDFCIKYHYSKSLTWLYYSLSMAYKHTKKLSLAEDYAVLCFANVIASNNKKRTKLFFDLLHKDFNKDPFLMVLDYKKKI